MKNIIALTFLSVLIGCSSPGPQRIFLDSTTHSDDSPDWTTKLERSWTEDSNIFFVSSYSVRGDERVNGCFDLALLGVRESVLSEIAIDIRGSIDNASQSISENAEIILGKVRTGEFSGRISGLKSHLQYFERYLIGNTERVTCHVLAQINTEDYNKTKRAVLYKMVEVDPKLKESITNKQINFFSK